MSNSDDSLLSTYLEKGRQSQMAMWSAIGNVFGFIVSAASVIAAVRKGVWGEFLFLVLLVCFLGITAVVSCFRSQKKEYVGLITKMAEMEKMTLEEKIQEAERVITAPSPVMLRERAVLILLGLSVALFLVFCWFSFTL